MALFFLLLIPIGFAFAGFLISKGKIDIRELGAQVGVTLLIVIVPYAIALHNRTADTEIWNGVVAGKQKSDVGCCHPYCCQTCQSCTTDSKGNTTCTSYCCQTCYEHSHDVQWNAWSSNNEHLYSDSCNSPGTSEPARYTAIRVGEPTAVEHSYKNYIKGNPDTLVRRSGQVERFKNQIPPYPQVYDYYRAQRFLAVGLKLPNPVGLNERLSEINAKWGAPRKVDIVVVVVRESDEMYLEALREAWIGGKINDIVIVVGVYDDASTIAWTGVISWTKNEQIKVEMRNAILDLKSLAPPAGHSEDFRYRELLDVVEYQVSSNYQHRRISDFAYLNASITPSGTFKLWLGIITFILNLGMTVFFWLNDPFDNGFRSSYYR
jgi:hypothetical protein